MIFLFGKNIFSPYNGVTKLDMTRELNMKLIDYKLRLNGFMLGMELEFGIKGGEV